VKGGTKVNILLKALFQEKETDGNKNFWTRVNETGFMNLKYN
jgi:hypothetical protein